MNIKDATNILTVLNFTKNSDKNWTEFSYQIATDVSRYNISEFPFNYSLYR